MKVLVADDDPVWRELLQTALRNWGYEVVAVSDGNAAWQALQGNDAPELVILDWIMPGLEGDQLCRQIRQAGRDRYTFVLLLTAKSNHAEMVRGLEAGADDCLSK